MDISMEGCSRGAILTDDDRDGNKCDEKRRLHGGEVGLVVISN